MTYWFLALVALLYAGGIFYGRRRLGLHGRGYPSPDEARAEIETLAKSRSDLCTLEEIGRSTEGRPIQALRIRGVAGQTTSRPRLLITANIHAVEYVGSYVARAVAARLVSGYGTVEHITALLDHADVWIVPLLNPDGAARVWRKGGWSTLGGSRFTANGVDPNRNFPFAPVEGRQGWNTARDKPGSPYYRGAHPLSEPECLALAQLCERERFCAAINFHSFGGVVYMPALQSGDEATRKAAHCLDVFHGVFQSHQQLRYRPVPERSAAIVGQLDSFLLNAFGTVSVTVEVSRPGLHVLMPWNIANVFWWANPADPQRWARNDVDATTHALAALLERTEGSPCMATAPQLAALGDASKPTTYKAANALAAVARAAMIVCAASMLSCSNPNYVLEACPMSSKPNNTATARQPSDLRVMTLNMWGIRFVSADIDARFDALADRLNADDSIDVVGLEEVWADAPRKRLLERVAKRFPYQVDFQGNHGRSGLAIISRHPFTVEPRFIGYPRAGKWWKPWTGEWFGGKGVGAVQIETGGGRVWFFVTHLHACYTKTQEECDADDEYLEYRSHQLETLRAQVNEIAGDQPALIVGDFNFTTRSPLFTALTTNGVYPADAYDPAWQRVQEPEAPARRIDYIWMRPGKTDSWVTVEDARIDFNEPVQTNGKSVPLSDHCAVAATVRRKG